MKLPLKILLRLGIAYSITEREQFEAQVSKYLEEKMKNPEKLEDLFDILFNEIQGIHDYLSINDTPSASENVYNKELHDEISALKKSIDEVKIKLDKLTENE